jgi:stage V sporulation protein B
MADYLKKVVLGAGILAIFSIAGSFLGYLMRFVMIANLSVSDYGLFYSSLALIGIIFLFRSLGLAQGLTYHISEFAARGKNSKIKPAVFASIAMQAIPTLILVSFAFIFSDYLSINYLKLSGAEIAKGALVIKILALTTILQIIYNTWQSLFLGFQSMKNYALVDFSRAAGWLIFTTVFLYMGFSYLAPAIGYFFSYVASILIFSPFAIKKIPRGGKAIDAKLAKSLIIYGMPIMVSSVAGLIIGYTDTAIITLFWALEDVGIYQTAQPTASMIWFAAGALAAALFPIVTELKTKDRPALSKGISMIYRYIGILLLPASLMAFAFSEEILALFFGYPYTLGSGVLKILAVGGIFIAIANINGTVLNGLGKPKIYTKVVWIGAMINLALNLLLIPKIGIEGAAIATLLSYFAMMVWSFRELKKFIEPSLPVMDWAKTIASGIIALGALYIAKSALSLNIYLEVAICFSVFMAVFGALIFALKAISLKEVFSIAEQIGLGAIIKPIKKLKIFREI